MTWRWHAGALLIFAAIALIVLDHGQSLTTDIAGQGSDRYIFIWFLAWWPWAIAHHASLLHTDLVWQPLGVFTFWVTSIPLLCLLAAPVTLLAGPILSYNLLVLAGPVLAAIAAYFLCLRLTRRPAASLVGGALFGFSPFEMAHAAIAPNLAFSAAIPATLLVALLRLQGELNQRRTIILGAALLTAQFLISIEMFATLALFAGLAWLLACAWFAPWRQRLVHLAVDAVFAGLIAAVILSPCLLSMLAARHYPALPASWPYFFAADLANFLLPTRAIALGGALGPLPLHRALLAESYVGLPMLAIIVLFARENAGRAARLLTTLFLLILLLSLGPGLWVAGHYTGLPLPWRLAVHLPLLADALPARFALYAALAAAIVTALWLAAAPTPRRWALALLACAAWWPVPPAWTPIPRTTFFQPGHVTASLGPNPQILILPFATAGPAMLWQVQSGFGFRQTGGYLGYPPAEMQKFPAVAQLFAGTQSAGFDADLTRFCAATGTAAIIAGPGTPPPLLAQLRRLHWPVRSDNDTLIFKVQ
jgi:hypothetical protein